MQLDSGKIQQSANIWASIIPGIGSEEIPDSMKIIDIVRSGLPGGALGKVAEVYQMPKAEIYSLLHISAKTGQRALAGKLDRDISDHLIQMIKVFSRANDIFKDPENAMRWLKSPCHALGNQIPVQLLDTGEGMQLVMNTLGRIEYGVFS
jgi:putative toxin-antitoxin system antitoxin component (TIGR02293 family)